MREPQHELHKPLTDEVLQKLAQRNEERVRQAQQALGSRWVCYETRRERSNEADSSGEFGRRLYGANGT